MRAFTHLDAQGNARMVDVSQKPDTKRIAVASGRIFLSAEAFALLCNEAIPKGDVFASARIAGIMATKQTSSLIPLCHPISLTRAAIECIAHQEERSVEVVCTTETVGKTGVEMEALTGATVALLTIYDMCKAFDRSMHLEAVRLVLKDGGASGRYTA